MIKFTQTRPRVSEYVTDVADLHIEVDKVAREYLGWQLFISRFDGPSMVESTVIDAGIYHSFYTTRREAYEAAAAYVAADTLLKGAI